MRRVTTPVKGPQRRQEPACPCCARDREGTATPSSSAHGTILETSGMPKDSEPPGGVVAASLQLADDEQVANLLPHCCPTPLGPRRELVPQRTIDLSATEEQP